MHQLLLQAEDKIRETLPHKLLENENLLSKRQAIINIHYPKSTELFERAQRRLKLEELFYIQFRLLKMKLIRQEKIKVKFSKTSLY